MASNIHQDDDQSTSNPVSELSLQCPTWEFLHSNFTKVELQKHCRELGLNKIWVTKEKLIDMIIEKSEGNRPIRVLDDEENIPNSLVRKIIEDIKEIKGKLNNKDKNISELTEKLDNAQVTIDLLYGRIIALEEQVAKGQAIRRDDLPPPSPISPERTLLLGDTNLCKILRSDLKNDCSIRTVNEANIDLLKSWVSERLNWTPAKSVLYCGIQDILSGATPNSMIDGLGALVSSLKEKNENMEIFICELVPNLKEEEMQAKVKEYNRKLIEWGFSNKINIIKTDLPFRLGTGEIDDMCFEGSERNSNIIFNRYGVIRLLDTIIKQYPSLDLCTSLEQIKRNPYSARKVSDDINSSDSFDKRKQGQTNWGGTYEKPRGFHPNPHSHPHPRSFNTLHSNRDVTYERTMGPQPHPRSFNTQQQLSNNHFGMLSSGTKRYTNSSNQYEQKKIGCYNCGEYNHRMDSCRYDHKLRCANCNLLGHKTKLCSTYNNTR